jgi:hypothetical protein
VANYTVRFCVAAAVGVLCDPTSAAALTYMASPVDASSCGAAWDQRGSVAWADIVLPAGRALYVDVTTHVPGQTSARGFFVRPARRTARWGRARLRGDTSAAFYLASPGQYSVEFAPDALWRDKALALSFPALMLFINPPPAPPAPRGGGGGVVYLTKDDVAQSPFDLGPGRVYVFQSGEAYDWGRAQVFKVHDDTEVYFEPGAFVRARIVQTEKKVANVRIHGYGVLDNHYPPVAYDVQGMTDDGSRQIITIYGKNIKVQGVTMINTNAACHSFGYCLNLNANWSPLADPSTPFEAGELQGKDPPYALHKAHCQALNMDGSPNSDPTTNCPTSHADGDGNKVSNVKCMTWQMGQDGLNAGKFGTVEDSFVRVIDDALKPWDAHGIYRNIVVWQLALGWPINVGWWNWGTGDGEDGGAVVDADADRDQNTVIDSIFVIHNHNWVSSKDWPETQSGQCVVGGVYGSGVVKAKYTISDVFVETACSCAVGLEISKSAYSRHLTPGGCVGSILDLEIDGMYVDDPFYEYGGGGYGNFISGETSPNAGCAGAHLGRVEGMSIAVAVAGEALTKDDFVVVDAGTVTNLTFHDPGPDPFPVPSYAAHAGKNAGTAASRRIDLVGVEVASAARCRARCHADWSCDCVEYASATRLCWKRRGCRAAEFEPESGKAVYVRP